MTGKTSSRQTSAVVSSHCIWVIFVYFLTAAYLHTRNPRMARRSLNQWQKHTNHRSVAETRMCLCWLSQFLFRKPLIYLKTPMGFTHRGGYLSHPPPREGPRLLDGLTQVRSGRALIHQVMSSQRAHLCLTQDGNLVFRGAA